MSGAYKNPALEMAKKPFDRGAFFIGSRHKFATNPKSLVQTMADSGGYTVKRRTADRGVIGARVIEQGVGSLAQAGRDKLR
jgi:hypothetical protein